MTDADVEHVLVVPTELFHSIGHFQGFCGNVGDYLDTLFSPNNISYRPRPAMEEDPTFKQLIPYVIFRHIADDGSVSVYQYSRGGGSGEKRLVAKKSVGIGGHIAREDGEAPDADPYHDGMARELQEEVVIDTKFEIKLVGLINDDETEVGRVHLGIVHICDVAEPNVKSNEAEIEGNGFQPIQTLLDELEGFETWSAICLKALFT